jgi:pentatricopeptide repeat protein
MALLNVDWQCVDSAAIRCYGRTGQLGAVRRLWQQLTKAEVSPSVFTFNSLLDGTYFFELIKGAAWHTLLKFLFDPIADTGLLFFSRNSHLPTPSTFSLFSVILTGAYTDFYVKTEFQGSPFDNI